MEGFVESKIKNLNLIKSSNLGCVFYIGILFLCIAALTGAAVVGLAAQEHIFAMPQAIICALSIAAGVPLTVVAKKSTKKSKIATEAEKNPSLYVRTYGTNDDTQAVIRAFDEEYNKSGLRQEVDPIFYLSENYLLAVGNTNIDIAKLSSIIWVYYEQVDTAFQNQRYRVYQFTLFFRDNHKKMVFGGARNENDKDSIMQALKNCALVVESDHALFQLSKKNYSDFEKECLKRADNMKKVCEEKN